jgi:outer membrane murein-binding lipoprotein Lpp
MPLPLPGEDRARPRVLEVLLVVAVVVGLCSLGGCAATTQPHARAPRVRRLPAPIVAAAHAETPSTRDEGAAFVERSLRDAGLRFGTDGSTRALWEYLRLAHGTVSPAHARAGDVLFFDTRATDADPDCDDVTDHAGIVESVAPDGRITFVEARGSQLRRSVVDPAHPTQRRNARGEVANTFLRAKQVADPPNTRYFSAEMLCGVARIDR